MDIQVQPDDGAEDVSADQVIEGGEVGAIEEDTWQETRHRAETAKAIAMCLLSILGVGLLLHYLAVWVLSGSEAAPALQTLDNAFNAWLPVISSLLSAAATYYFTREKG